MPAGPEGLDPAAIGTGAGAFLLTLAGGVIAYIRGRRRGVVKPEPAQVVAAALGAPGSLIADMGHVRDAMARLEAQGELATKFADETGDEIRELRQAMAERDLHRTLETTQVMTALGRIEAAVARIGVRR